MNKTCKECGEKMKYHDYIYIGNLAAYENGRPDSGFKVVADIYKCENEECSNYNETIRIDR